MGSSSHSYSPPSVASGSTCQIEDKRSVILALRNSGALNKDCHYVITDYNRGAVGSAKVLLHAVDANTFSQHVGVLTIYDNTAWEGRYDIDTNRLIELSDDLGNVVYGDTAVDAFPWGVAAVFENTVTEGVINHTGGTATELRVHGATVNISGGTASRLDLKHSSTLTITGGSLIESTIAEDADVFINSGANYENRFGCSSTYRQVGSGYIRYSEITGNSTITNGDTALSDCNFRNATALNLSGSSGSMKNVSTDYASLTLSNISNVAISQATFGSGSSIAANAAQSFELFRVDASSGYRFLVSSGKELNVNYFDGGSNGYIQVTDGRLNVRYSRSDTLGRIVHNASGDNLVDRFRVGLQSLLNFRGASTGCRVFYSELSSGSQAIIDNSINSYMYYCGAREIGVLTIRDKVDARMYYCSSITSSYIGMLGGAGQSIMYYCTSMSRGYIEQVNNGSRVRFYGITASSQSIIRDSNSTVASNLYYSSVTAYYYMLLTLTGGTRFGLHGFGRQTFTGAPLTNGTGERNWT